MISILGNLLLLITIVASSCAILTRGRSQLICFYMGSTALLLSFVLLLYGFITSDFALKNVFLNSSTELPLIYKIAASWASHEGSILFWVNLLGLVSSLYVFTAKLTAKAKSLAIVIFTFIQILFASFIIFISNPFDSFSFVPSEGLGLNPMLQDIALSIHPPILYLGNVCYGALFTGALVLLYKPEETEAILALSKKFSSLALSLLTIGIGLGSWWAYRELGWGGYWFFDPVENISLLPWLSGIALHHFLVIYHKSKRFVTLIVSLSLISFLLVLYGTFVVRSGIITSVHSFAFSPERGIFIFSICCVLTVLSLAWFFLKQKKLPKPSGTENIRESTILLGNIFWLAALASLIIALVYPIYCYLSLNIDIVIDPDYFYKVFIPICIPIILLASITPRLDQKWWLRVAVIIVLSAIIALAINNKIELGIIAGMICFASICLIGQTLDYVLVESHYFSKNLPSNKISLFLAHGGFGLLALAIVLNCALSREVKFIGQVGDKINQKGLSVKLENVKFSESLNYFRQIAVFRIEDEKNNIVTLKPENRLYKIEKSLSQEVDIFSFLFYDLYAVLSQVDQKTIHAQIYYQPFISFIWLSVIIIASGFLISVRKK